MTFLISFPSMFRRAMDLKAFGKSYDSLLGFGMMIDVEILKYEDQ